MPSPVIGSTTLAASPANSTRPCARRAASNDAGIGQARCVPSASAPGPRMSRNFEPLTTSRHCAASCLPVRAPLRGSRSTPKPTLARPPPSGEDPRVPGQEVGVEQHPHPAVVDAAEVLAERVPGAELGRGRARSVGVEHAAHGGVVAVGGDDPLRGAARCRRRDRPRRRGRSATTWVTPMPSRTVTPSSRARSTSAASSSARVTTPAYSPSPGSGSSISRPLGETSTVSVTDAYDGSFRTSSPSASSPRSAPVVRPSPQVLSRGNRALSTTSTSSPRRRASIAAAVPAGPAPDDEHLDAGCRCHRSTVQADRRRRRFGT